MQVIPEGTLLSRPRSGHASHAARIGMLAWQEMQEGRGVMSSQLCDDASGIADRLAIVELPDCPGLDPQPATSALILASMQDDVVRHQSCLWIMASCTFLTIENNNEHVCLYTKGQTSCFFVPLFSTLSFTNNAAKGPL